LVKEPLYQISSLREFPVAQNLGATLGLQDSLQVASEGRYSIFLYHLFDNVSKSSNTKGPYEEA
jgi:hypothetical protein